MHEVIFMFVLVALVLLLADQSRVGSEPIMVGASRMNDATVESDLIAIRDSLKIIPTQFSSGLNDPEGVYESDELLLTTSSANQPVFNTIPSSQLTLSQMRSMDFFVTTASTPTQVGNLPQSFDSRTNWPGLIADPLDQLTCGSCWSFGVSSMVGDRIRIHSRQGTNQVSLHLDMNNLASSFFDETVLTNTGAPLLQGRVSYRGNDNTIDGLSPYYFAGCDVCGYSFNLNPEIANIFSSRNLCSNCCSGGVIQYAMIWLMLNGVSSLSCTSAAAGGIVDYSCSTQLGCPVFRVKNVYRVNPFTTEINDPTTADPSVLTRNMESIMREISTNGPVAASYYVYPNFADWPFGTVYDSTEGTTNPGGHTIMIIGYGTGPNPQGVNKPYWLCKNSWSTQWGENGFFRILRGSNFCRIEQDCWACTPFTVYDTSNVTPPSGNPLESQISTLCSSPPSYDLVKPGGIVNPNA